MRIQNPITLLPLTVLVCAAVAQNSTSTNTTCKATFETKYSVNASALVEVPSSGSPPWYLGVTFGDERNGSNPDQSIYGSLSTPANSTAYACTRLLRKLLPATGAGANGNCSGILSDNCIDFLRRSLTLTQPDVERKNCPDVPVSSDVAKACPPLADSSANFGTGPSLVSNYTCSASRLAGTDQPPEGYENSELFGIFGFGDEESDGKDPSKFTWYDKYVSQPMLWTVSAFENGESRTSVVCVRPERVADGSRVPSESGASGAGRVEWGWSVVLAAAVVVVIL